LQTCSDWKKSKRRFLGSFREKILESVWQYEAACVGVPSMCLLGAVVPQRAAWGDCSTARGGRGQWFHAWPFVSLLREYDEHILAVPFNYMSRCDTLLRCS
jgi:hypothetical protein